MARIRCLLLPAASLLLLQLSHGQEDAVKVAARMDPAWSHIGLGKRAGPDPTWSMVGLGKRAASDPAWSLVGLGKRAADPTWNYVGLGKKSGSFGTASLQLEEKRASDPTWGLVGLGKKKRAMDAFDPAWRLHYRRPARVPLPDSADPTWAISVSNGRFGQRNRGTSDSTTNSQRGPHWSATKWSIIVVGLLLLLLLGLLLPILLLEISKKSPPHNSTTTEFPSKAYPSPVSLPSTARQSLAQILDSPPSYSPTTPNPFNFFSSDSPLLNALVNATSPMW